MKRSKMKAKLGLTIATFIHRKFPSGETIFNIREIDELVEDILSKIENEDMLPPRQRKPHDFCSCEECMNPNRKWEKE